MCLSFCYGAREGWWKRLSIIVLVQWGWNVDHSTWRSGMKWDHRWTTKDSDALQPLPAHLHYIPETFQAGKRWWKRLSIIVLVQLGWKVDHLTWRSGMKWDHRWTTKDSDALQPLPAHLHYIPETFQAVKGCWKRHSMIVPAKLVNSHLVLLSVSSTKAPERSRSTCIVLIPKTLEPVWYRNLEALQLPCLAIPWCFFPEDKNAISHWSSHSVSSFLLPKG